MHVYVYPLNHFLPPITSLPPSSLPPFLPPSLSPPTAPISRGMKCKCARRKLITNVSTISPTAQGL